jgi:hypothetical protein
MWINPASRKETSRVGHPIVRGFVPNLIRTSLIDFKFGGALLGDVARRIHGLDLGAIRAG